MPFVPSPQDFNNRKKSLHRLFAIRSTLPCIRRSRNCTFRMCLIQIKTQQRCRNACASFCVTYCWKHTAVQQVLNPVTATTMETSHSETAFITGRDVVWCAYHVKQLSMQNCLCWFSLKCIVILPWSRCVITQPAYRGHMNPTYIQVPAAAHPRRNFSDINFERKHWRELLTIPKESITETTPSTSAISALHLQG